MCSFILLLSFHFIWNNNLWVLTLCGTSSIPAPRMDRYFRTELAEMRWILPWGASIYLN